MEAGHWTQPKAATPPCIVCPASSCLPSGSQLPHLGTSPHRQMIPGLFDRLYLSHLTDSYWLHLFGPSSSSSSSRVKAPTVCHFASPFTSIDYSARELCSEARSFRIAGNIASPGCQLEVSTPASLQPACLPAQLHPHLSCSSIPKSAACPANHHQVAAR